MENIHHDVYVDLSMAFTGVVLALLAAAYVWSGLGLIRLAGDELSEIAKTVAPAPR